jgi:hypothetical protein
MLLVVLHAYLDSRIHHISSRQNEGDVFMQLFMWTFHVKILHGVLD